MENIAAGLLVTAIVVFGISGIVWTFSRSHRLLEEWASSNGYDLISAHFCWIRRGPFFWTTSKGQTVYRIIARDEDGERLTGWARCGSFWWGLWGSKVEVRWD